MLQRIQSVYLFVTTTFLALLFSFPYASFVGKDGAVFQLGPGGLIRIPDAEKLVDITPVFILVALTILIAIVTIFLYKNRVRQMRFTVFNMLLMAGIIILLAYYIIYLKNQLDAKILFKVPLLFPLFGILFSYLAFRNIRKDEILIKSIDRLR